MEHAGMVAAMRRAGADIKTTVDEFTDLVVASPENARETANLRKARTLNIPIATPHELNHFLSGTLLAIRWLAQQRSSTERTTDPVRSTSSFAAFNEQLDSFDHDDDFRIRF